MPKYKLNSVINTAILYEIREEDKNKSCIYLIAVYYKKKWTLKYGWCFNLLKHIKLLNKELQLNCDELYTKKYYIPKIIPLIVLWTNSIDTIIDFEYKFPTIMRNNNLQLFLTKPNGISYIKNSLKLKHFAIDFIDNKVIKYDDYIILKGYDGYSNEREKYSKIKHYGYLWREKNIYIK